MTVIKSNCYIHRILFTLFLLLSSKRAVERVGCYANSEASKSIDLVDIYYERASLALQLNSGDHEVMHLLIDGQNISPNHSNINQLLGALYLRNGDTLNAIKTLETALITSNYRHPAVITNLLEAYRQAKAFEKGYELGSRIMREDLSNKDYLKNYALLLFDMSKYHDAKYALELYLDTNKYDNSAWELLIQMVGDFIDVQQAEEIAIKAMKFIPNSNKLLFQYAAVLHMQQRVEEALQIYLEVFRNENTFLPVISNIGAIYQTLGKVDEALSWYLRAYDLSPDDAGIMNNLGSLYGIMNQKEYELICLLKAVELNPNLEPALINLGGIYQDDGDIDQSRHYLQRAFRQSSSSKAALLLRVATMMSPLAKSHEQMVQERLEMEVHLLRIIHAAKGNISEDFKVKLDSASDRIHFYIVYHAYNDRYLQELVSAAYRAIINDIEHFSPSVQLDAISKLSQAMVSIPSNKKIRVAFISKFFGIFEPHGQLLDGIMKHLPRNIFTVLCLPIARTDGKPLSSSVAEAVDEIYEISLLHHHAITQISKLNIDILIFADVLSEPMNHYLAYGRLAKIQIAFWGNPVTSASRHMDYFVSGYHLEHPFRTRMRSEDDPYTEQVVLLSGQGIWYNKPLPPDEELIRANISIGQRKLDATREEFHLDPSWFIYLCPQSTFKIHPLYDKVFAEILYKTSPHGHLVVTGGRRPIWTKIYRDRLIESFKGYTYIDEHGILQPLSNRLHVLERVSSERFLAIIKLADVVLHPFPFDGSRTSADSLIAGVPYVTLPTEYLRGRMGASFYRTMNIPELVAQNRSHYIKIAVGLFNNKPFLASMKELITQRTALIWEDMEGPYEWSQFIIRISRDLYPNQIILRDIKSYSWNDFILSTKRNLTEETILKQQRDANRRLFQQRWGNESWLLSPSGQAVMETFPSFCNCSKAQGTSCRDGSPHLNVPRVFADWNFSECGGVDNASLSHRFETIDQWSKFLNQSQLIASPVSTMLREIIQGYSMGDASIARLDADSRGDSLFVIDESKTDANGLSNRVVDDSTMKTSSNKQDVDDSRIDHYMSLFHESILQGNLDKSYDLAMTYLYPSLAALCIDRYSHPQESPQHIIDRRYGVDNTIKIGRCASKTVRFITEIGLVQFYRGNYKEALELCNISSIIIQDLEYRKKSTNQDVHNDSKSRSSITAYLCMNIASTHLGYEDVSVKAITIAWDIYQLHQQYQSRGMEYDSDIFKFSKGILEYNMISTLKSFHHADECVTFISNYIALWSAESHQSEIDYEELTLPEKTLLTMFSFVNWSVSSIPALSQAQYALSEDGLIASRRLQYNSTSLYQEIIRSQGTLFHILDSALDCMMMSMRIHNHGPMLDRIAQTMLDIVYNKGISSSDNDIGKEDESGGNGLILLTQYFISSNEQTQVDMNEVLQRNLNNEMIDRIILLNEEIYSYHNVPQPQKLQQYKIGRRLTFGDAFRYANEHYPGRIIIIANADIYFDTSLHRLMNIKNASDSIFKSKVMALLKWKHHDETRSLHLRTDSQDAWIFLSPINDKVIALSNDLVIGTVRCDNRLAKIFEESGYDVINPAFAVYATEIQTPLRKEGLYDMKGAASGAGKNLLLSDMISFS